jgi:transposase
MQFIQAQNRFQTQIVCWDDFITQDNPVRFIDAFVEKIELEKLGILYTTTDKQKKAKTNIGGAPRFDNKLFLKLYLYGYLNKIRSSRKLAQECQRNIELQWLLQQATPNYHSIADFRKKYPEALKALFKLYVQFLCDNDLIGKTTIAIDGTKIRAVNSKKNNYNQKKIDKHQALIEEKTNAYLQQLDELDKAENKNDEKFAIKKEKINEGLQKLKERKLKYNDLQTKLDATTDKQISTTDADSRSILVTKAIVEVAYNIQNAVDDKHNLIVHTEATNTNDGKALYNAAIQAKANIQLQTQDSLILLADKGYHTGAELQQCQNQNITTHVAYKEQPSVKHIEKEFLSEQFIYNLHTDSYTCPAGATLTTLGTWHNKKGEASETSYRFKTYRTDACKKCPLKEQCTKLPKRIIHRSEYQNAVDTNNNNIKQNPHYYKRRQAIVEHPFGTIKRSLGYTYTLLKGKQKVNGELNLIMLCYNIKRSINIIGIENILKSLYNWKPNYAKAVSLIRNSFTQVILSQNKDTKNYTIYKQSKNSPPYLAHNIF